MPKRSCTTFQGARHKSRHMPKTPAASRRVCRVFVLLIVSGFIFNSTASDAQGQTSPELLTYEELVQLYEQPVPAEPLQRKLTALLNTPFVSNAASQKGVKPIKPQSPVLGSVFASRLLEHRTGSAI